MTDLVTDLTDEDIQTTFNASDVGPEGDDDATDTDTGDGTDGDADGTDADDDATDGDADGTDA